MRRLTIKRWQSFGKFSEVKVMDMMLERLRGLQEDQLSSLASLVATCSLNEVLAEVGNHQRLHTTNIEPTVSDHGSYSSMDTSVSQVNEKILGSLNSSPLLTLLSTEECQEEEEVTSHEGVVAVEEGVEKIVDMDGEERLEEGDEEEEVIGKCTEDSQVA
ncbi:unnamed protein product [Arabidopsis halleri]